MALLSALPIELPAPLRLLLETRDVPGARIRLDDENDLSGLAASMQVFRPQQIVSEALQHYPGILAMKEGMLPFAVRLEGSGDPYFFAPGGSIVRVPHAAATGDTLVTWRR